MSAYLIDLLFLLKRVCLQLSAHELRVLISLLIFLCPKSELSVYVDKPSRLFSKILKVQCKVVKILSYFLVEIIRYILIQLSRLYITHLSVTPVDFRLRIIVTLSFLPPIFLGSITSTIRDCVSYVLWDYWMSNNRCNYLAVTEHRTACPDTTPMRCNMCGQCPLLVGSTEQKVILLKQ